MSILGKQTACHALDAQKSNVQGQVSHLFAWQIDLQGRANDHAAIDPPWEIDFALPIAPVRVSW